MVLPLINFRQRYRLVSQVRILRRWLDRWHSERGHLGLDLDRAPRHHALLLQPRIILFWLLILNINIIATSGHRCFGRALHCSARHLNCLHTRGPVDAGRFWDHLDSLIGIWIRMLFVLVKECSWAHGRRRGVNHRAAKLFHNSRRLVLQIPIVSTFIIIVWIQYNFRRRIGHMRLVAGLLRFFDLLYLNIGSIQRVALRLPILANVTPLFLADAVVGWLIKKHLRNFHGLTGWQWALRIVGSVQFILHWFAASVKRLKHWLIFTNTWLHFQLFTCIEYLGFEVV